jgi:membrane associated rhomboid family serine protease
MSGRKDAAMGFLPLGTDTADRRRFPGVTWTIVAVNVAVWLLELHLGAGFQNGYAVVPEKITSGHDLSGTYTIDAPGTETGRIAIEEYPGPTPIYLTLLTAMFMHGSWLHIIGNMWYLILFGDQIEDLLGHGRYALFYLLCGLAANAAQIAVGPHSLVPCLGASGAIAGCLGAYLIKYPTKPVRVIVIQAVMSLPAWIVLGAWIAMQVISTAAGGRASEVTGVAYMAHIGGFLSGIALVMLLGIGRATDAPHRGHAWGDSDWR